MKRIWLAVSKTAEWSRWIWPYDSLADPAACSFGVDLKSGWLESWSCVRDRQMCKDLGVLLQSNTHRLNLLGVFYIIGGNKEVVRAV